MLSEEIEKIKERVKEILIPILKEKGLELVDMEFVKDQRGWTLRIFLDYPTGGITISDCEWVSDRLGTILDIEDFIPVSYILEISSPGLDRPLKTKRDFERNISKIVKISTFEPQENQRNFKGEILEVGKDFVKIFDVSRNDEVNIKFDNIKKAKLDLDSLFDIPQPKRKNKKKSK